MRKGWMRILALLLALLCCAGAAAETVQETNGETGYRLVIEDEAGLLDSAEIASVREAMLSVTEYANVGFYTYPSGGGSSTASATKAQRWGDQTFGSSARFTVFIIDMYTRHLDIYASRPLADELTAAEENSIADNVYRLASREQYGDCAVSVFEQIATVLKGGKIATPMKYASNALMAVILAILAAYLLISGWIRKEQAVSMPNVIKAAGIGAATVVTANHLSRVVHHSSGGGGGGHGGGGGGGGGGGSSGGHGF